MPEVDDATVKAELIWEGKHDGRADGADPDLSLERSECIEASQGEGRDGNGFRNRLILGDNRLAMVALAKDFRAAIDLIYIDPPFDAGTDVTVELPLGARTRAEEKSPPLQVVAYRDRWGAGGVPGGKGFARKHDDILVFTKSEAATFNPLVQKSYVPTLPEPHTPSGRRLGVRRDEACELCGVGRPGQKHRMVRARDVWDDVPSIFRNDEQATGYATQKPEALLARIIGASSNEGDLVADFFCGSGTTGVVAERLGRRWIMADIGRLAVHTTRKRMLGVQRTRAFDVYHLGSVERKRWARRFADSGDEGYRWLVLARYGAQVVDDATRPLIHGRKADALCSVAGPDCVFDAETAGAVAEVAHRAGEGQVDCLAWAFAPGVESFVADVAAKSGVRVRPVVIPREIMDGDGRHALWFAAPKIEAEAVVRRGQDGPAVGVRLTRYVPSLIGGPESAMEALCRCAEGDGFGLVDSWAVNFDWRPGGPFCYDWQACRSGRKRDLETESHAAQRHGAAGRYTLCVKAVDAFGHEAGTLVAVDA